MAEVLRDAPGCMEKLSELLAQRKMETEGVLKEAGSTDEHGLNKGKPIHSQLLAPAPDFFPIVRFR